VFAGKVDNVGTIFLNNQSLACDAISSEVQKGKILVINVNCNQMSKENTLVLTKCFIITSSSSSVIVYLI
jgi:hypothetical protein